MRSVEPLSRQDALHLQAAQGWLELDNHIEAYEELEKISAAARSHPEVLQVRWNVYAKAGKWDACAHIAQAISKLLPECSFGWVHLAYSLHELKRTKEALTTLLPVADKFHDEWVIPYNLACYCCQLGDLNEALRWLERAFAVSDKAEIKIKALEDRDLEPLWKKIGSL